MRIDKTRVRKSTSDIPFECQQLIERLQACSRTELLDELSKINTWTFGKCELLHWASVLDVFDKILGEAAKRSDDNKWALHCDTNCSSTASQVRTIAPKTLIHSSETRLFVSGQKTAAMDPAFHDFTDRTLVLAPPVQLDGASARAARVARHGGGAGRAQSAVHVLEAE